MEYNEFLTKLQVAIDRLVQNESSLFTYSKPLREEAISHQLANKLGDVFSTYSVDCEYSRQPDQDQKRNDLGNVIRPDILIHTRGHNNNNLAVIEVKWDENPENDIDKITAMSCLQYKYGCVVRFNKCGHCSELKVYIYQSGDWKTIIPNPA
jgi:hypothetical protein